MAVQREGRAPYASTGSIKTVIDKHRQVGLLDISLERLQRIGVTEALAPRTLYALTFLGFYDEHGRVTPEFDALRKLPEHEFKPALAELLKQAYAPVLENLDPATATQLDVENALRGFEPTGQLSRMVQLFIGLMTYAGLMPAPQRRAGAASAATKTPKAKTTERRQSGRSGQTDVTAALLDTGSEHEPQLETPTVVKLEHQRADAQQAERIRSRGRTPRRLSGGERWLRHHHRGRSVAGPARRTVRRALRKLIKDIEALGASGLDHGNQTEVSP